MRDYTDMGFCCFCSNFSHNRRKKAQNHPIYQLFFWEQLNYLEDTLEDLESKLEFYHRDVVCGPPLAPGLKCLYKKNLWCKSYACVVLKLVVFLVCLLYSCHRTCHIYYGLVAGMWHVKHSWVKFSITNLKSCYGFSGIWA